MWKILLKGKSLIGKKKDIMKNFLSLLLPLAMLASGCAQEELQNDLLDSQGGRVFTASFEQNETRTYLEEGSLLRWNAGDQIALFDGNTLNRKYKFDGETGDNSGTFSIVSNPFGTGNDLDCHYAVCPYASGVKITENGVITATLPAEQSYAENSFGICANTMVAVTKDLDDTFLKFKNVGGYLKLQLYGDDIIVKSISLTGGGNEKIAGKASITPVFGQEPVVTMSDDATSGIILNCGEGVKIGTTAESATAFWIVVPPTTFENGFVITITDINSETFTKSTSNEITVERNVIKPMKAFEVEMGNGTESEDGTIPNHQIWYTANAKVEPYWDDVFGANIVSNVWDSASGKGVITFDSDVTKIGEEAFYESDNLVYVTIPDSVTEIGEKAFYSCNNLTSVIIGENVMLIDDYAFWACNLISATIPDKVTSIGERAFSCISLTSITIGNSVTMIGERAFQSSGLTCVTIPDSVTTIGDSAFEWCWALQEFKGKFASDDGRCLIVDGTLTAFAQAGLTEYAIPDNVISIGNSAFYHCDYLTKITIPDSVISIGNSAFSNCSGLTSITIPDSVITIGDTAFHSCGNLNDVTLGSRLEAIGYLAFGGCNLTDVIIPDSVIIIGQSAFSSCSKLSNIKIGNGVITIGINAFKDCCGLTDVIIPDSVTSIGGYAFENCSRLKSVTIGKGIENISYGAFLYCGNLETVYCNAEIPPIIGNEQTFKGCSSDLVVYVPAGSLESYKVADYWRDMNIMETRIPNNQIWYIAPLLVSPYRSGIEIFGANILSNEWDSVTGKGVITFDADVTTVGDKAFYGYNTSSAYLISVTMPHSVINIGEEAFFRCERLTNVSMGDSITSIGYNAFHFCHKLTSITIPNSLTTLGDSAFSVCVGLKEFKGDFVSEDGCCLIMNDILYSFALGCGVTEYAIPSGVTTIGVESFAGCGTIRNITIPSSVTTIKRQAFDSCSLESIIIPDEVTNLGDHAFLCCDKLKSVSIGNGITAIEEGTFYDCYRLSELHISKNVTMIGPYAFANCRSLTSLTIPSSVNSIAEGAFWGCTATSQVYIAATTPPTLASDAFKNCDSDLKIYVPSESLNAYKAAEYWKDLNISGMPEVNEMM